MANTVKAKMARRAYLNAAECATSPEKLDYLKRRLLAKNALGCEQLLQGCDVVRILDTRV
jgi:hypothetical protein